MTNKNKIVVFDMDETLGYFSQLYVIWISLLRLSQTKLSIFDFYKLSDIYIFYYHPTIFKILKFLKTNNINIVIFTNNQGLFWWPKLIALYLNYKISNNNNDNIFKTVIGSYKLQNKINDNRRTSMMKKYDDLKNIMNLNDETKVLFLDDQEHPEMRHPNVDYFKVPNYIIMLPPSRIVNIFLHSNYGKMFILKNKLNIFFFMNNIFHSFKHYNLSTQSLIKINNDVKLYNSIYTKILTFVNSGIDSEC